MPGIFLALTIISGLSFAVALGWAVRQWSRADREVAASEHSLEERLRDVADSAA